PVSAFILSLSGFSADASLRHLPPFPTRRSSDLGGTSGDGEHAQGSRAMLQPGLHPVLDQILAGTHRPAGGHLVDHQRHRLGEERDRKSTRLNSSHGSISYAVFCLKKKNTNRKKT